MSVHISGSGSSHSGTAFSTADIQSAMENWASENAAGATSIFSYHAVEFIVAKTANGVVIQLGNDYQAQLRTGIYLGRDHTFIINAPADTVIQAARHFFSSSSPSAASGAAASAVAAAAAAASSVAAASAPAPAISPQEIPREDLITLRSLLAGKYTFATGTAANLTNTLEVQLENGESYRAWFNSTLQAFNFQKSSEFKKGIQKDKTGVGISPDGRIVSVYKDNVKVTGDSPLLTDRAPVVKLFFEKALEVTSTYQLHAGSVVDVRVVGAGLKTIPEFHLDNLGKQMRLAIADASPTGIRVIFTEADLQAGVGIDAGGLARQYLNSLFEGLTGSNDPKRCLTFEKAESGLSLPMLKPNAHALSPKEVDMLRHMGTLFMHCYDSSSTSHYDRTALTGRHFDDELFQKALQFSADDLDDANLNFSSQVAMAKKLFASDRHKLDLLNILSDPTLSESGFAYLQDVLMLDEGEFPSDTFPGSTFKEKLQNNWPVVREKLFKDHDFDKHQLPIRAIAQGMMSACVKGGPYADLEARRSTRWEQEIRRLDPQAMSDKIQGSVDRETIASSIQIHGGSVNPEITKKTGWLQKWIRNSASDQDIRNFLKFTTGSTSLLAGKKITIRQQVHSAAMPMLPVPRAHTCSLELELAPVPCHSLGSQYDDATEDGFIRALGIALANPEGYQAG